MTKGKDPLTKEYTTDKEETTPIKTEFFLKENYESFPEVKNIVLYLNKTSKDVKILDQTNKRLVFCLSVQDVEIQDESIISVNNYVKLLEKDGYQLNLRDGTISSTFELKKEKYNLSITLVSDINEWKNVHKDEMNTKDISKENLVCEVFKI